jgi:hypothetical protein
VLGRGRAFWVRASEHLDCSSTAFRRKCIALLANVCMYCGYRTFAGTIMQGQCTQLIWDAHAVQYYRASSSCTKHRRLSH